MALPGEPLVEQRALVAGPTPAPDRGELPGQAVLQERSDLVAERSVVGALPQVHDGDSTGRSRTDAIKGRRSAIGLE
jgi:hypothetical protein